MRTRRAGAAKTDEQAPRGAAGVRGDAFAPAPTTAAAAVLQRAVAAPRSIAPGDVLRLQRSIGNRAVGRLLAHGAPRVQRARLKTSTGNTPGQHVSWYFSGETGKDMLKAEAETRQGNSTERNHKTAFTSILKEICREKAVAYANNGSLNILRTNLVNALRGANHLDDDDVLELDAAINARLVNAQPQPQDGEARQERKPLTAKVWKHIWRGDYNATKKRPTGYHWKGGGADAWLDVEGDAANETGGFYNQSVVIRAGKEQGIRDETGAAGPLTREKATQSTFFPDDWSEAQVKEAVETRDSQGHITSEEDVPEEVTLTKVGDTIFPIIG